MSENPFLVDTAPSRRARKKSSTLRAVAAAVAVIAALSAFVVLRNSGSTGPAALAAVFVEPGADNPSTLAAGVNAELGQVATDNGDLLVGGVVDGQDATTYFGTLTCPADQNTLTCKNDRTATRHDAGAAADRLLAAARPATVDLFSPFRLLASHLESHPAPGGVEVFLNVSGRNDGGSVDLRNPAVAGNTDAVVAAILKAGLFPADTKGWVVHLVMPTSGNPGRDAQVADVLAGLLEHTGGTLASTSQRWLATRQRLDLPGYMKGVSGNRQGAVVTFTLGETLFETGSADLSPDATTAIDTIADRIVRLGATRAIQVAGFADSTGTPEENLALSSARASNVRDALAARLPPGSAAVSANGYGSLTDTDAASRQQNRRVDVIVTTAS